MILRKFKIIIIHCKKLYNKVKRYQNEYIYYNIFLDDVQLIIQLFIYLCMYI